MIVEARFSNGRHPLVLLIDVLQQANKKSLKIHKTKNFKLTDHMGTGIYERFKIFNNWIP